MENLTHKMKKNSRFKRICVQLQGNKLTKARLHFICAVSSDFESFLRLFQEAAPLIHILHDELTELLRRFLHRFVKEELILGKQVGTLMDIKYSTESYMKASKFNIGNEAKNLMEEMKTSQSGAYKTFYLDVLKFFETTAKYMINKLPLNNVLLKNLSCLHPLLRSTANSVQMVSSIVDNIPMISSITELKDKILQDWRKYQEENIKEDFYVTERGQKEDGTPFVNYKRIDEYWNKVLQITDLHGQPKYESLSVMIKAALCLSHGQADVERGFSLNKQIIEDRATLSEKVLCNIRTLKEVVNKYDSVTKIPITRQLLAAHKNAFKMYKEALETNRQEKEASIQLGKRKQQEDDQLAQLQLKKREWVEKQKQAEKMLVEGTERLGDALKNGKLTDAIPAQALLQTGNKLLKECHKELDDCNKRLTQTADGQHQPNKVSRLTEKN